MSLISSLGRAASDRRIALKVDRALVRTAAGLPSGVLLGAAGALVLGVLLSPVVVLLGFGYGIWVIGQALLRRMKREDLAAGASVRSRIGGASYRLVSDDDYLRRIEGVFEPEVTALFAKLIQPGDTVLDIGANIGCTSILFSKLAAQVFSFEPSPSTFRFLQTNLVAAGATNVTAFNVGFGRTAATHTLTFAPNNRSGGFVSNKLRLDAGHQTEVVTITDGASFLGANGVGKVDFIKIDVEGFELEVLAGLKPVLEEHRPVVVLEMNHWCLNAFQRVTIPEFLDTLLEYFPVLYAVDGDVLMNLRDPDKRYFVTLAHITQGMKFQNLIGCFDIGDLARVIKTR